jgi:glucan 1,3-beta-glucosidase
MNVTEANNGAGSPAGDASVANLQTFLDTFVCEANTNGTKYF